MSRVFTLLPPVLEVRDLTVTGPSVVLRWQQGSLQAGEALAIVGPSGLGKTTLLLALLGLRSDVVITGELRIAGAPRPEPGSPAWRQMLREQLTLVLQDARASLDPFQKLGDQLQAASGASLEDCIAALRDLGIADAPAVLARAPHQVSGGQAQRVLLAIALLRGSKLILADEPTASLDSNSSADLVRALTVLRERGSAVVVATHDLQLVQAMGATTYRIRAGVVELGEVQPVSWPHYRRQPGSRILAARGIRVQRHGQTILRDVDLELHRNEVVAVTGASGAGKTSLARVLTGQWPADQGTVERPARRLDVQMLFQDAYGSLTPGRSIQALVQEVAMPGFSIATTAASVGLSAAHLQRTAETLSGGERRRAALLRALSVEPAVLILDEPTASLDRDSAIATIDLLMTVQQQRQLAMLLITHDLELAAAVADRVIHLEAGVLR